MSDGDDTKTKEQLLAEIAALKEQLAQRDAMPGESAGESRSRAQAKPPEEAAPGSAPVFAAPMTRRQSIVSWVAPVILSLPVVQVVGAVIKPGTAHAVYPQDDYIAPTAKPTASPTNAPNPTAKPTAKPTVTPTAKPTASPKPTAKPTASPTLAATAAPTAAPTSAPTATPTRAGRCIIAPTAAPPTTAPSAAPTIGMASTPDSRPIAGGFVPLGDARALVGRDIGP